MKIPELEPYIGKEEFANLKQVIDKKWLSEGPFHKKFLHEFKNFVGAEYAVLVPNGTLAIYLSLLALDIKKDDEVIIPDFTFNASASPITFLGGKPVFVDIEDGTLNLDPNLIEKAITKKTKAIMPVHIYGQSCDMDTIWEIADKYNLAILEDAAESVGVFFTGDDLFLNWHTGTIGDLGIFSFFTDKTITMGEGGAIVTDNEELYNKLVYLRNQGRTRSGTYIHPQLGMNFHITDLQCAVGLAQLEKYPEIEKKKLEHYRLYQKLLEGTDVKFLEEPSYTNIVPFRMIIRVKNRDKVIQHLEKNDIQTRQFFYPLHRQPCFKYLGYKDKDFPVTNKAYSEGIRLPIYPSLQDEQIEYICDKIKEVI